MKKMKKKKEERGKEKEGHVGVGKRKLVPIFKACLDLGHPPPTLVLIH
jgi:hypothetical protein